MAFVNVLTPMRARPRSRAGHKRNARGHGHAAWHRCRHGSQAAAYGETIKIGEAAVTLVPAGHVLGSAQVLIEWKGARAVVSGDYKRSADPTCSAYELVCCQRGRT